VRYKLSGEPLFAGYCCCADCQKASGSGFIPFLSMPASAVTLTGPTQSHRLVIAPDREALRNFCPQCGSLLFGGDLLEGEVTIYAGSLDDANGFEPTIAIFTRDKPNWVVLPDGLRCFEGLPG
jgi:hypothetical protein